jgi:mono/diheme cytochrome c family protein
MHLAVFMSGMKCARPIFCAKNTVMVMLSVLFLSLSSPAQNPAEVSAGKALFADKCAVCHGEDASGKTEMAKSLHVAIPDYRSAEVQNLTDDGIKNVVTQGKGSMPPVSGLSAPDIANLIAFVRSFSSEQPGATMVGGSAIRGEALFAGRISFRNGGPACAACHSVAGLPFPSGGTLGPNLTHEYTKLGPEGLDAALETLYFPAMVPLYDPHPLTAAEQADLEAFFKSAGLEPSPPNITPLVALIALGGFLVLIVITWALWRDRIRGVRRKLVESAVRHGAESL